MEEKSDQKGTPKMVPLSSLVDERRKAREKINDLEERISDLESDLIAKSSETKYNVIDDEDEGSVSRVKSALIEQDKEIQKREKEIKKREATIAERERKATAKEVKTRLTSKGIEVDEDDLLNEEDMEKFANNQIVEFLAKENEELKKTSETTQEAEESTFESANIGKKSVSIESMSDEEFEKYHTTLKEQAALVRK